MLTGHGDGPATLHQEDRSRRRQPFSFLRYSGWRARRRFSRRRYAAQARPTPLMLLPSIPGLSIGIALLSSLFHPHDPTIFVASVSLANQFPSEWTRRFLSCLPHLSLLR